MRKNYKLLISILSVIMIATSIVGCSKKSDENTGNLNVDSNTKEIKEEVNKVEQKNDETNQESSTSNVVKISENKDKIISLIRNLHNFSNGNRNYYNSVKKQLNDLNITVDDNIELPYTYYTGDGVVLAGIIINEDFKTDGKEWEFNLTTRSAKSSVVTKSPTDVGKNVKEKLAKSEYEKLNKNVSYKLSINEDDTQATLSITSGNWLA